MLEKTLDLSLGSLYWQAIKWPNISLHEYLRKQVLNYSFIVLQAPSLLENCIQCNVRSSKYTELRNKSTAKFDWTKTIYA